MLCYVMLLCTQYDSLGEAWLYNNSSKIRVLELGQVVKLIVQLTNDEPEKNTDERDTYYWRRRLMRGTPITSWFIYNLFIFVLLFSL